MKIHVDYETETSIEIVEELEDKINTFFSALGYKNIGSGAGGGKRDLEYEKPKVEFNLDDFSKQQEL